MIQPHNIPDKWRVRCKRSKNGGVSQCRPKNVSSVRRAGVSPYSPRKQSSSGRPGTLRSKTRCSPPPNIFLERLFKPSVAWEGEPANNRPDPAAPLDAEQSDTIGGSANEITPSSHVIMAVIAPWTEPFLAYLTRQELPEDQNEARCIVRRSKAYRVHEGEIYKKSTTGVLQRCISEEEGRNLLAEIHAGLGSHHAAARSLVSKAFRTGFYWPTAGQMLRT